MYHAKNYAGKKEIHDATLMASFVYLFKFKKCIDT